VNWRRKWANKMILEEARKIALEEIKKGEMRSNMMGSALPGYKDRPKLDLVILDNFTRTEEFGWVFFYDNRKYIETEDIKYAVAGNAPIIVTKDGLIHLTGTAHPIEYYIDQFREQKSDRNFPAP